jgi:hypothetical protein
MADSDHNLKLLTFNERCRWEAWRDPARIKPGLVRKIFHEQAWTPEAEVEILPLLEKLAAGEIVARRDDRDVPTRFWGRVRAEAQRLQQEGYLGLGPFKLVMMIEERTRGVLIPTEIEAPELSLQTPLPPELTEAVRAPELEPQREQPEPQQAPEHAPESEPESAPVDARADPPLPPGVPPYPSAALIDTMSGRMARTLWVDHKGVQPNPDEVARLDVERKFQREHPKFDYKRSLDKVSSTFEEACRMLSWRWRKG